MLLLNPDALWLLLTADIPDCGLRKHDAVLVDPKEGWQDDGYYVVRTPQSKPGKTNAVYPVKVLTKGGKIRKSINVSGLKFETDEPREPMSVHKVLNRYQYREID